MKLRQSRLSFVISSFNRNGTFLLHAERLLISDIVLDTCQKTGNWTREFLQRRKSLLHLQDVIVALSLYLSATICRASDAESSAKPQATSANSKFTLWLLSF